MPNVLIRDLPDDIHARLQQRAEAAGQSLQQYLTQELTKVAGVPSMEELLTRIGARSGGTVGFDEAVADLARERSDR
jgi:plasmid stability protein